MEIKHCLILMRKKSEDLVLESSRVYQYDDIDTIKKAISESKGVESYSDFILFLIENLANQSL